MSNQFVTHSELREEIRNIMSKIKDLASDFSGANKTIDNDITSIKESIEILYGLINKNVRDNNLSPGGSL